MLLGVRVQVVLLVMAVGALAGERQVGLWVVFR